MQGAGYGGEVQVVGEEGEEDLGGVFVGGGFGDVGAASEGEAEGDGDWGRIRGRRRVGDGG